MAKLSSARSQTLFQTTEEPELSSINFSQSLRFFQDQLNVNGISSPTPSLRSLNLPTTRNINNAEVKENLPNSKYRINFSKESSKHNSLNFVGSKTSSNCSFPIPNVDTFLESVRVLRAIQKSQELRGSSWSLNVAMSDADFDMSQYRFEREASKSVLDGLMVHESSDEDDVTDGNVKPSDKESQFKENLAKIKRKIARYQSNGDSSEVQKSNIKQSKISQFFWPVSNMTSDLINSKLSSVSGDKVENPDKTQNGDFDELAKIPNGNDIQKPIDNSKKSHFDVGTNNAEKPFSNGDQLCYPFDGNVAKLSANYNKLSNSLSPLEITKQMLNKIQTNGDITQEVDNYMICTDNNRLDLSNRSSRPESGTDTCSLLSISADCSPYSSLQLDSSIASQEIITTGFSKVTEDDAIVDTIESIANRSENTIAEMLAIPLNDTSETCKSISSISSHSILDEIHDHSIQEETHDHLIQDETHDHLIQDEINDHSIQDGINDHSIQDVTQDHSFQDKIHDHSIQDKIQDDPTHNKNLTEIFTEKIVRIETANEASKVETKDSLQSVVNQVDENLHNTESDPKVSGYSNVPIDEIHVCKVNDNKYSKQNNSSLDSDELVTSDEVSDKSYSQLSEKMVNNCVDEMEVVSTNTVAYNGQSEINPIQKKQVLIKSEDKDDIVKVNKITTASWNLEAVIKSLYRKDHYPDETMSSSGNFERNVFLQSKGAFIKNPEGDYVIACQGKSLYIKNVTETVLTVDITYGDVSVEENQVLKLDNKMGRCLYFACDTKKMVEDLKETFDSYFVNCMKEEYINLVHYPMKCHQNVVIIDLGSCSTRAGVLMNEPTLPFLFFPSVCATHKETGKNVYGTEAFEPDIRQNSTLTFPIRPSVKIIKHNVDVDLIEGIFDKIFKDLKVNPNEYSVLVCLPRTLSLNAQNALVKLLLETFYVKSVSLTHQALLTLYAHNVSTGLIVDIGDRMDIVPVVDGFIVENGVTRLPYGGQRIIHHMKHALAAKHMSLSNEIDSFVVQYITENISYIAEDYENELKIASQTPSIVQKSISLAAFTNDGNQFQNVTLDEGRFKVPEGLFQPDMWGLDHPGIHHLVQKAIQATGVDARKRIAENIYVSGGVTLTPGFVERLLKEITAFNKPRITPKVTASNYRYHCTYIGACTFASMNDFPKVCLNSQEYNEKQISSLKKFALCL